MTSRRSAPAFASGSSVAARIPGSFSTSRRQSVMRFTVSAIVASFQLEDSRHVTNSAAGSGGHDAQKLPRPSSSDTMLRTLATHGLVLASDEVGRTEVDV